MKNLIRLFLVILFTTPLGIESLNAQIVAKRVIKKHLPAGTVIPELLFESVIKGPENKTIDSELLLGKIVVLEFWGTWCAPCIKQFPKLNELAEKFSEEEVVIISVTDESEDIVKPFLKRRPLKTWVVSDTDKSVINDFGVNVFPTTVIINQAGQVHEYISADSLTSNYLRKLLENKKTDVKTFKISGSESKKIILTPEVQTISYGDSKESNGKSVFSISIEEDEDETPDAGLMGKALGLIDKKGWTIKKALANAYGISETLIYGPNELLNTKISVKANMPRNNSDLVDAILREALAKKFSLKVTESNKDVELLTLSAPNGLTNYLKLPKDSRGKFSADDGVIAARHWKLKSLIKNIELELSQSIYDNTQLDKKYDYDLYWDHNDPQSIITVLKEQLGLVLQKKVMKMKTLKVQTKE